jgi:hypothetical protein
MTKKEKRWEQMVKDFKKAQDSVWNNMKKNK